jgi:S1-C subfamily serine protease
MIARILTTVVLFVSAVFSDVSMCGTGFENQSPYNSICQIRVGGGQGSGTLIAIKDGKALILTCRHVAQDVDAAAKLEWLGAGGQVTTGNVLAIVNGSEFNSDLALIVCDAPDGLQPVRVAKFDPTNGPWHGVGWRGGQMYETFTNEATDVDGAINFNSTLIGGQSGGALLDRNGCLVGVTVASDFKTMGIASDGRYLSQLLKAHTH